MREVGDYLSGKLDELVRQYDFIAERRGRGLMQGLAFQGRPVGEIVVKSQEMGLLVITAGNNVLRLVPPLIIEKKHVDEMLDKLTRALF